MHRGRLDLRRCRTAEAITQLDMVYDLWLGTTTVNPTAPRPVQPELPTVEPVALSILRRLSSPQYHRAGPDFGSPAEYNYLNGGSANPPGEQAGLGLLCAMVQRPGSDFGAWHSPKGGDMRILSAALPLALVCAAQAQAHIPERCNQALLAAEAANRAYTRETNAASDKLEALLGGNLSQQRAASGLREYFSAAQMQAIAVGIMMQANQALVVCVSGQ